MTRPSTSRRPGLPVRQKTAVQNTAAGYGASMNSMNMDFNAKTEQVLLRREIGEVLRSVRQHQGRTLREVSSQARVSLGYLSEVERGQKEASSELLEAITDALGVPLWYVLREVSDRMAIVHGAVIPDTVPDDLVPVTLIS